MTWIPISEYPPEPYKQVLVCNVNHRYYGFAHYDPIESSLDGMIFRGGDGYIYYSTHWTYLPEMPDADSNQIK